MTRTPPFPELHRTTLFGWGNGASGRLAGANSIDHYPVPITVPGELIRKVSTGDNHTVFWTDQGLFWCGAMQCSSTIITPVDSEGRPLQIAPMHGPWEENPHGGIMDIGCGSECTFVVHAGQLYACGSNSCGQLGLDDCEDRLTFTLVEGELKDHHVVRVFPSSDCWTTFVLTSYGGIPHLFGCGSNYYNRGAFCAPGSAEYSFKPIAFPQSYDPFADPIVEVSPGKFHTLALTRSGKVYGWGWGEDGRIGATYDDGSPFLTATHPTLVAFPQPIRAIACYRHSLAVGKDGQLYAFGPDPGHCHGDGDGTSEDKLVPTPITLPGEARAAPVHPRCIAVGRYYEFSLVQTDRGVFGFGSNTEGCLGNGETGEATGPVEVGLEHGRGRYDLVTGTSHCLAVKYEPLFL
eukprot:gnl/Trimastix_PCT/1803.p1 GENE.gnl/Trimastix_PCT/1803~~gnl/Trimastix_PCT/1803.p1  ORF type:complete len:406 (+),score=33.43 gnl/Trimastix_PCT/1803:51-1268(+)